ncbi:hypothetical protein NEHOM01_1340 [Nematocida homosporus]|uniref:uncharacterized protein n=1 Tax=Nematocida homosporus TaxID=1912981 RepID=UPI0022205655|nr:uncharacterized protein NEHOM01_1340 [Nematocida homosporus]KAI5186251.1 hypothetical protein NEHOM01_1340 [Nematocida homosporus]
MEKKYKEKEKTEDDYLKEVERINYKTALEAQKTLNSISKTTSKTQAILSEQREKLEDIMCEADSILQNVSKGKELSVKMQRASKFITIGDKISDKVKGIFKSTPTKRPPLETRTAPLQCSIPLKEPYTACPQEDENPTEDSTNAVLLSIRDGLKDLQTQLKSQNREIEDQMPLIKEITEINKTSTEDAGKVLKNLKKL